MISLAWREAIDSWCASLIVRGAPHTTISARRQALEHLARRIGADPGAVTETGLLEYLAGQVWAQETRRGRRTALMLFFAWWCQREGATNNPAAGLPRVKPPKPNPRPTPESVYLEALVKAPADHALMLRLAAEYGLRRAEVAQVHSRDVLEDLGGWSLRVHGKGNKVRIIPLAPGMAALLRARTGYVFPGAVDGHLSPRWVGTVVTRLLPGDHTMHSLRHRFATRAYNLDKDVFIVQELLGHASPATTRLYVQVERDDLRRTVLAVAS